MYNDGINQVGKSLGQTQKNSEAALRRAVPTVPKIERTRDIFDNVIPFEMDIEVDNGVTETLLDLYFNKPPPVRGCGGGRFGYCCDSIVTSGNDLGEHLLQVSKRYKPGSMVVFKNGVQLPPDKYYEYDPENGLVYVPGSE